MSKNNKTIQTDKERKKLMKEKSCFINKKIAAENFRD